MAGVGDDASATVRRMCEAIRHRGPDDEGFLDSQGIHLGMRRLAIIDVAHGAQPIANEDGTVVTVFNGEIYNHRELRRHLQDRGHHFATAADTECLVHLYEEYGTDLVRHLRGIFAFAIWDHRKNRLMLARDRVGKKPLFYYHDPKGPIWFASELKSLLSVSEVPAELDPEAIYQYLSFGYVPDPLSAFRRIRKLPPAHVLTWSGGRARLERYWDLRYAPSDRAEVRDERELTEQFRDKLVESTRIRMLSERPIGAFLSGGLDSSAVVAAMRQADSGAVRTFSIGFAHDDFNELPYAREVARIFGTQHEELEVTPDVEDLLPQIARAHDEPFADTSAVPSFYLAELARQSVVVTLNGDGGDESFAGYTTYKHFQRIPPDQRIPPLVQRAMRAAASIGDRHPTLPRGMSSALTGAGRLAAGHPWERYARLTSNFTQEEVAGLLQPSFGWPPPGYDLFATYRDIWRAHEYTDPVNRMMAMDIGTYLPGDLLPKVDISTMAASLEARSPLLDHHVMEWAASLPGSLKLRDGQSKYIMKMALEPWLPQSLINRRKKGFGIPVADWLLGPLRPLIHDLVLSSSARIREICQADRIREVAEERHVRARPGQLWSLLMLELWLREVAGARPKH